jgi:transposase
LLTGVNAAHVIADKGYDSDGIVRFIEEQGAIAVIPPRSNRRNRREYDRELYKRRNLIERAFNRLKHWRRIATRYDRRSIYFLSALHITAAITWST